uniref:Uncharacterized protein n=1 Tax=Nelumbo nucifera TaxID=4432 RepID=A0A822Z1M7_NELNU|nr:TPA_asm: hypothetical protein HUJ06_013224 [Nelumbo nucifera]
MQTHLRPIFHSRVVGHWQPDLPNHQTTPPAAPSPIPNHTLRSLISNFTLSSPPKLQSQPNPQTLISTLTSTGTPPYTRS